jgi:hypothetical protein
MSPRRTRARVAVPTARRLPPDERSVAAAILLRAGASLSDIELELCRRTTRPGAPPLHGRDKLRLAELVGRHLGRAAP